MHVHPEPETVTALVRDAITAPSLHNSQPWAFRYVRDIGTLELRADPDRGHPVVDPAGRALHLGCGACLFALDIAALHRNLDPDVTLLPDLEQPELVASARFLRPPTAERMRLAALQPMLRQRHSSRFPYADAPVDPRICALLSEAAAREGATLDFPGPQATDTLLDLTEEAWWRDALDTERAVELRRWTRIGPRASDTATDGVPDFAFGPRRRFGRAPVRDFAAGRRLPGRATADFESAPLLAVLLTAHDTRADWLRAGRALHRVLLVATLWDLVASLGTEVLEQPDLRHELLKSIAGPGRPGPARTMWPQAVVRLGHGPRGPDSPRRPVQDVLTVE
ncbi:nitroreductase [Streptomyces sp. VRA16 Mangrove soil]|uniref:Acg family FMN-binding oxidoreductase n=1 Tax=Streptomyces sp. VRA16 Mangrove soil TaxID=2817434 RepID=UPI001A9EADCC|nr:nitroreductase [Streptomyces sp. VRA16 Mangrove soil]MBO1334411.1 nitroreductase [Streptomyces sp. VRA16 Mangrove soil]